MQEVTRAIDGIQKRYQKSAQAIEKDQSRIGRAKTKEDNTALKGLANFGKAAQKIDAKIHADRLKAIAKEDSTKIKGIQKEENARLKSQEKASRESLRLIKREASERERFARSTANRITGATGRGISQAGRAIGLVAGLAGGVSVSGAVTSAIENDTLARGIANRAAPLDGETRSRGQILSDVNSLSRKESQRTGISKNSQLGVVDKFIERAGNFKGIEKLLPQLNDLGQALGVSEQGMSEMGDTAGTFFSTFSASGMKDADASKATMSAMNNASMIGLKGQLGPEELSRGLGKKLMGASVAMGGSTDQIGSRFGMMMNLANTGMAIGGIADADVAGTAGLNFVQESFKHEKKLKALGINAFDKNGNLNSPEKFIPELIKKTGGSEKELGDILGERGVKLVSGFGSQYRNLKKGKEQDDYIAGLGKSIAASGSSVLSQGQIQSGAAFTRESPAAMMQKNMDEFNETISKELLPVVSRDLIPALAQLAPYVASAAKSVAEFARFAATNPFLGLGAIMSAFVVKELASAALGQAVSAALTAVISGRAVGGVASLVTGGAEAVAGAAGLGAAGASALAVGAAGALAAGAVATAVYEGVKLYQETAGVETTGDKSGKKYTKEDQERAWAEAAAKTNAEAAKMNLEAAKLNAGKNPSDKPVGAR